MDPYQIILDMGALGALRYANAIDAIDPILASKIDSAIIELEQVEIKCAQSQIFIKQAQSSEIYQKYLKELPPVDYSKFETDSAKEEPQEEPQKESKETPAADKSKLNELQIPAWLFQSSASVIQGWIAKNLIVKGIKQESFKKFLQQADSFNLKDYVLNEIYTQDPSLTGKFGDVDPVKLQAQQARLGFNIKKNFSGLDPNDIKVQNQAMDWLDEAKKAGVPNTALDELKRNNRPLFDKLVDENKISSTIGSIADEAAESAKMQNTTVNKLINEITKKVPALTKIGPFAKFVAKAAPIIGGAFEAAGLYQIYDKEGASPRFICNGIRALIFSASTFFATGAAIGTGGLMALPAAAGAVLSIALNYLAQIYCDTLRDDRTPKGEQKASQSAVDNREASVTFNDLSGNDQRLVESIFSVAGKDSAQIRAQLNEKLKLSLFDNPVDSVAYIQKRFKSNR